MFKEGDVVTIIESGEEGRIKEVIHEYQEVWLRYRNPDNPCYFTHGFFSFSEVE